MDNKVEKIDIDHVDWKSSREFFESLGEALDKLDDRDEAYSFSWVGKRKSIIEAGSPISKTLRPDIESSKDFNNTKNMLIVGDNLDALKLLQESYLGEIKMIYIDPPYNTGKDFVYHDNYTRKLNEYTDNSVDQDGNKLIAEDELRENSRTNGRFHSDWLSMMYPRLKVSKNLLKEDGVIIISIDDNEQSNLKTLCDEVFGEDNYISTIVVNRTSEVATDLTVQKHEYALVYARDIEHVKSCGKKNITISRGTVGNEDQTMPEITFPAGLRCANIPDGTYDSSRQIPGSNENIEVLSPFVVKDGKLAEPVKLKARWRSSNDMRNFFANKCQPTVAKINGIIEEIYFDGDRFMPYIKKSVSEKISSLYLENKRGSKDLERIGMDGVFQFPKAVSLISYLCDIFTEKDDIILDYFAGSGTTGQATMELNLSGTERRFICVQLNEDLDKSYSQAQGVNKNAIKKAIDFLDDLGKKHEISELTIERLKRSGEKIKQDNPEANIDYGFRVLRVDSSNEEENSRKKLNEIAQENLFDSIDNIKKDRKPLDLLYGIISASALPYDLGLEVRNIGENSVYLYGYLDEETGLVACFDDIISEETIKEIARLKPLTATFKDSSFPDSATKINLSEHFRVISPDTKVKVI